MAGTTATDGIGMALAETRVLLYVHSLAHWPRILGIRFHISLD